jgi:HD-like signal output (HDOD) protein
LLHDVGRPVLLQALLTSLQKARATADREAVLALVSELHESAGSALAKAWTLPDTVVTALAKHHSPKLAEEPIPVRIVSLADAFAHKMLESELTTESVAGHPALAALEIYPDALEKLVKRASPVKKTIGVLS